MIWETRGTVRRPLGHIGIIMAEPDATPHYCFVMDKLDGGVRVSNPNGFKVPSKFILRYAGRGHIRSDLAQWPANKRRVHQ